MRYSLMFFSVFLTLLLLFCNNEMAQTAQSGSTEPPALSKRALRNQDRDECTKQAVQQNIAMRNRADTVRRCMADRQASRKASKK
jgi:hypothetical protein